jgi:hypothetical protein
MTPTKEGKHEQKKVIININNLSSSQSWRISYKRHKPHEFIVCQDAMEVNIKEHSLMERSYKRVLCIRRPKMNLHSMGSDKT